MLVRLKGGTEVSLALQGTFDKSEKIKFCIRPEKMFFVDEGKADQSTIVGTIEQSIYVGETKRYAIRIDDQLSVNLRKMSIRTDMDWREGEHVRIGWFDENVKILA